MTRDAASRPDDTPQMRGHDKPVLPWQARWTDLRQALVTVDCEDQREAQLTAWQANVDSRIVVAFVNAHAMNCAASDPAFHQALRGCDILLRDGSGMALHLRLHGQSPGLNMNGTDLIPEIITRFDGRRIALVGTREPYLGTARDRVISKLAPHGEVDIEHGFHDTAHYVDWLRRRRPALIVLGMGMPKQEHLALALRSALHYPCIIVCGGAIIDFLGARVSRAPLWLRWAGLEWAYRLTKEPVRLFKRYVIGNPLFVIRSLVHFAKTRRSGLLHDLDTRK